MTSISVHDIILLTNKTAVPKTADKNLDSGVYTMKKFLALVLALVLVVALCGCSKAEYGDLRVMDGVTLSEMEYYGIAFRKGSDMVEKVEDALQLLW